MTSAPAPGPAIELAGLTQTFRTPHGTVRAVRGIDLDVRRGEVVALLGTNGAGKTTTLDVVLGLARPAAGTARVLGLPPRRAVAEGRVSAVLQTGGLLEDLSVAETVRMIAALHPHHAPVAEVLARAGLEDLARRRVSTCSGGQRQRLRFALALLPEPDLLVLDEPTAGMDVAARRAFWATMHAEADRGRTVLFATHHLEEADAFAGRVVVMAGGRIVADGPTDEVRARATRRTVSVRWTDDADPADLPHVSSVRRHGARVVLTTTDPDALCRHLLTRTAASGLEVGGPSLETAFLDLTSAEPAGGELLQPTGSPS